jgi:hypothetical protein
MSCFNFDHGNLWTTIKDTFGLGQFTFYYSLSYLFLWYIHSSSVYTVRSFTFHSFIRE